MYNREYFAQTGIWLADRIEEEVTVEYQHLTPSAWAEQRRTLPRSVTPKPGPFSFEDTPYWVEVLNRFDQDDDARFVTIQKGAQVAATTGVLENVFGYLVEHLRSAPGMYCTADDTLTKLRVDQYMIPMLEHSDMAHLIQSNSTINTRKQGATGDKIEWIGGGFLLPVGAQSANKMRSFPVQYLLRDEVSGWPLSVGKDADPMKLTETRTDSFSLTRKVLDLSTPNKASVDIVSRRFKLGDQRYFYVPCKHCGEMQVLKFRVERDNSHYGLHWDHEKTDTGRRITPGSVRYVCPFCGGEMINEDKSVIMRQGEWRPSATPSRPGFYSYHLSGLYAPWYAKSWEECALDWFEAWDDETRRLKDGEKLQVFYNNVLGEPYEERSEKLKRQQISPHRRDGFNLGTVPHRHAKENAGGGIHFLTMSVDVQDGWLAVGVLGFAPSYDRSGYNPYVIDYFEIKGGTEQADSEAFKKLEEIIDCKDYGGMRPVLTVIDASYRTDAVYAFCAQWETGVFPIRGRDKPIKGARFKEFEIMESAAGIRYLSVTVDLYKDRAAAALRRRWNGVDKMPRGQISLPSDLDDKVINHLTVEYPADKIDPKTNKNLGTFWYRPGGSRQELWDLLVYCSAAFEVFMLDVCKNELGADVMLWGDFWAWVDQGATEG